MDDSKVNNIKDAIKEDTETSFGLSNETPLEQGEFYRRRNDQSGTVSSTIGYKVLFTLVALFIIGILGYTLFFY